MMIALCHVPGSRASHRRGTALPLIVLSMTALLGFLALSIDLSMLAISKTQVQQAADLVALTAARTTSGDGSASYNQAEAQTNAQNVLTYNVVMGQPIDSSQMSLSFGSYDYDHSTQTFSASFPPRPGVPSTAVAATITASGAAGAFGKLLGASVLPSVSATAQAVHRPRDIALVMDLSGSMRMGTCLGFEWYTSSRSSNNPDPLYPTFGHYSSSSAGMQGPSTSRTSASDSYTISPSNTTYASASYTRTYINNFYQQNAFATPLIRAFDSYTSTDGGDLWSPNASGSPLLPPTSYTTTPGGDVPLFKNGSTTTYATHVRDVLGSSTRNASWELDGYSNYSSGLPSNAAQGKSSYASAPFYGYTQGPGYYGKSFFIWPPDPRRHLTRSDDSTALKQFLTDFGYTSSDFSNGTTGPPLYGVYQTSATSGSRDWPWPKDGGTALSDYLTSKVYVPGGSRKLTTSDSQYQQIMRLYSWDYVVDNQGTTPCDWRIRFFGTNDNTKLFSTSNGALRAPSGSTYTINYNEILRWITQSANPFPQQLRAGRIKYYGSIPTSITGSWPNFGSKDQRFWAEFIDYVLGFRRTSSSTYQDVSAMVGYGGDFTWGSNGISSPPSSGTQYMSYTDNPDRPKLRFWFGPLNMVDFMQNYNMESNVSKYFSMQPGDSYEAPVYTAKMAYQAAISTMHDQHPNDLVSLIPYSSPRNSSSADGRFNCVACPLGNSYDYARAALFFPFSTINADGSANNTEITPYDPDPVTGKVPSANFLDTQRAGGSTCFAMALMLAFNQFAVTPESDSTLRGFTTSSPINFPPGMAGGMGRKGSQKVVIFETDGLANYRASAPLVNAGTYKYYKIRYDMNDPSRSEFPSISSSSINNSTTLSQVYSLVQQLATNYSTARNPFRLYTIGFGPVFEGPLAGSALQTLQSMQYYAGTQSSPSTPLNPNQIVTGTDQQMSTRMVNAFTGILQSGVQIALIK